MNEEIGVVFGSSSSRNFDLVITSPETVETTDYVKAWHPGGYWVLARITEIERENDSQTLEDLDTDASQEVIKASAYMLGNRNEKGLLRPPRSPLSPGDKVYPADKELVKEVLGLHGGTLYLGKMDNMDVLVKLEAKDLVSKHCSIMARTGSGKSYAAGVLMEELMEQGVSLLVIDPHGEFSSLRKPNTDPDEKNLMKTYDIQPKAFPQVKIFSPDQQIEGETFRMNGINLEPKELKELVPNKLTNSQLGILYESIKKLKEEEINYTIDKIIEKVKENNSKAKWNLINSLEYLRDLEVLSAEPTPITKLVEKGKCSVLDMRGIQPEMQEIIVARTARKVFEARKSGDIPPLMMFLEEAHNFIPERGFGKASSSEVLRTVASEGRKFGLGLCVISQRPAKVDKNVLSQCNTQIILKVTNPNDLKAISKGVEGLTSDMKEEISTLPPGVALLVSTNIERPILVDIRVRKTLHGEEKDLNIISDKKKKTLSIKPKKQKRKEKGKQKTNEEEIGTETEIEIETETETGEKTPETEEKEESFLEKLFKKKS